MIYITIIVLFAIIFLGVMFFLNKGNNAVKHYLLIAIIGGIISVIACLFIEFFSGILLDTFFSEHYYWEDGWYYFDSVGTKYLYVFIDSFLLTALVEESVKYITTFALNEKKQHKLYNYLECIIPYLIIGVVFSVIEDALYIKNIEGSGLARVIIFFTGHVSFSMIFGYFYYKYRVNTEINNLYYEAKRKGVKLRHKMMPKRRPIVIGMLLVTIMHGMNNFIDTEYYFYLWTLYIIIFIVLFKRIIKNKKRNAKEDAIKFFLKKYLEYKEEDLVEMEII